jgi:branched-chain amino acid transport system permease protein
LAGALLAIPSLRAKGPYLAMVTLAFGFVRGDIEPLAGLTNGPMGSRRSRCRRFRRRGVSAAQYFWLIAGVALLCQVFANNLLGSRRPHCWRCVAADHAERRVSVPVEGAGVRDQLVLRWIGRNVFAIKTSSTATFVFALSVPFLTSVLMGGSGTLRAAGGGVILI